MKVSKTVLSDEQPFYDTSEPHQRFPHFVSESSPSTTVSSRVMRPLGGALAFRSTACDHWRSRSPSANNWDRWPPSRAHVGRYTGKSRSRPRCTKRMGADLVVVVHCHTRTHQVRVVDVGDIVVEGVVEGRGGNVYGECLRRVECKGIPE
jgi:hypothetical protein